MTIHNSTDISERSQRIFKFKGDSLSQDLYDNIQPVVNISPIAIVKDGGNDVTGAVTLYTVPEGFKFYLTGAEISIQKSVACDNDLALIGVTLLDGTTHYVLTTTITTLTAVTSLNREIMLTVPIVCTGDIKLFGAFTVGAMRKYGAIYGYLEKIE